MSRKWTIKDAQKYIERVENKAVKPGLKYCSAKDYIKNHTMEESVEDGIRIIPINGSRIEKDAIVKHLKIGSRIIIGVLGENGHKLIMGNVYNIDHEKSKGTLLSTGNKLYQFIFSEIVTVATPYCAE